MRALTKRILQALEDGQAVELVSVLTASGSTPRGAGAQMAVFPDGSIAGTVGGGNVEYEAQKLATELLAAEQDAQRAFRFIQGDAASLGMVCGGDVTLQFQFLSPQQPQIPEMFRRILAAAEAGSAVWLVRKIENGVVAETGLADKTSCRYLSEDVPADFLQSKAVYQDGWFVLPAVQAGRTYIFGGGHVAQALVPLLATVGFRPVVYDDRAEFADPALFPLAEQVRLVNFDDLNGVEPITSADDVVIMTRGHQADYEVLAQTLRSGARYIGCIGSKKKLALCRERLMEAGFTAEEYAVLHAPIGLAIGAETPAEIAVSVAAEMVAVRAGKIP